MFGTDLCYGFIQREARCRYRIAWLVTIVWFAPALCACVAQHSIDPDPQQTTRRGQVAF